MTFRVGQKVVCVDANFSDHWLVVKNRPVERCVYTVREITMCTFGKYKDVPSVLLEEVRNPVQAWREGHIMECPFSQHRFRPVVERKTDISIFTKMLNPQGVDA